MSSLHEILELIETIPNVPEGIYLDLCDKLKKLNICSNSTEIYKNNKILKEENEELQNEITEQIETNSKLESENEKLKRQITRLLDPTYKNKCNYKGLCNIPVKDPNALCTRHTRMQQNS